MSTLMTATPIHMNMMHGFTIFSTGIVLQMHVVGMFLPSLITGDLIDAQTAQNFGLINKVVSPEKLNKAVMEIANKILKKSYTTIATGKKAFYHQLELGISKAYDFTSEVMAENMIEYNAQEGVEAFLQKRSPIWKD